MVTFTIGDQEGRGVEHLLPLIFLANFLQISCGVDETKGVPFRGLQWVPSLAYRSRRYCAIFSNGPNGGFSRTTGDSLFDRNRGRDTSN